MKNVIRRHIFVTLLVQAFLAQAVLAGPWPALETDQQKLAYGLALRSSVKGFFSQTFNYGLDWWQMTATQERLKRELTPLYSAQLDTHPLLVITLNQTSEKSVPGPRVQAVWKSLLLTELANHPQSSHQHDLVRELEGIMATYLVMKPGELINQLMKAVIQKGQNPEILRASVAEKINFIRENIPDDLSKTPFYANSNRRYSIDNVPSRERAIQIIENGFVLEQRIPVLAGLVALAELKRPTGAGAVKASELAKYVEELDGRDLAAMQDQTALEPVLRQALTEATIARGETPNPEIAKSALASMTKQLQKLTGDDVISIPVSVPVLALAEEPRDSGILRSTTAIDCVHTCSFSKIDDPSERVFYVKDPQQNKILGYVQGGIKNSKNGKVFYVTSINGPTLTPDQAETILQMLISQTEALGVNAITLSAQNLEHQMNYQPVIDRLHAISQGRPIIDVRAQNQQIADIIDSTMEVDYQKDSENRRAVLLTGIAKPLATSVSYVDNNTQISGGIEPKAALIFALELDAAQRTESPAGQLTDGERAIVAAQLNLEDYRHLRQTLQNRTHLPYQHFLDTTAKTALAHHGIELDKNFLNAHAHVFYDAQLASSDAIEGSLRRSTFILVGQLIKRGIWHPTWGLKEFGRDPVKRQAFDESKEMDGVMRWLMVDLNFHSIQARNMVFAGLGIQRMNDPEVVRELLRLTKHGWAWGPDLSREILKSIEAPLAQYAGDADVDVAAAARKLAPRPKRVRAAQTCKDLFN